jgi:fumarate reductase flavoprotein subunit
MDTVFAMMTNEWKANPDVSRAIMFRNDDTLNWLEDMGVVFDPTYKFNKHMLWLGMPACSHMPIDPEHPEEGYDRWLPYNARGFIHALEKRARALGVEIMTNTPAMGLLQKEGRVIGAEARTKDGNSLTLRSKATVIASGGFGANREMIREYALPRRADAFAYYAGCDSNRGDGIRMAQTVGAALEAMDAQMIWDGGVQGIGEGPAAFYNAATQLVRQPSLTVNKLGQRFFNEATIAGLVFEGQANATIRQKDMTSFTIHDADTVQKKFIIEKFDPGFCEYPTPRFDKSFAKGVADGVIMKAESIRDLAGLMGVDPIELGKTVDTYNAHCDTGQDLEYFKPAEYLAPIRKAPFYAVKQVGGALVWTLGGIKVNADFQVLDSELRPIPGLYAAGQAVSWSGTLQAAFNSGRIAGENGAGDI